MAERKKKQSEPEDLPTRDAIRQLFPPDLMDELDRELDDEDSGLEVPDNTEKTSK